MILKTDRELPISGSDGTSDVRQNLFGAELPSQRQVEIEIAGSSWYLTRVTAELEKVAFSAGAVCDVAMSDPAHGDKGQALNVQPVLPANGFNECSFVNYRFCSQFLPPL